jgi:hypothetical protein
LPFLSGPSPLSEPWPARHNKTPFRTGGRHTAQAENLFLQQESFIDYSLKPINLKKEGIKINR